MRIEIRCSQCGYPLEVGETCTKPTRGIRPLSPDEMKSAIFIKPCVNCVDVSDISMSASELRAALNSYLGPEKQ